MHVSADSDKVRSPNQLRPSMLTLLIILTLLCALVFIDTEFDERPARS